jgi:malonyl-CoA/methylmalonyl-CoA synthetase
MQFSTIPLIARAENHSGRTAIIASEGIFNYRQLLESSARVAQGLLDGKEDLREERVAFLVPRGFHYVALQWGIWRAGGIAVPLCEMHPPAELDYVIGDSDATIVVANQELEARLRPIAEARQVRFLRTDELLYTDTGPLPEIALRRRSMILYTSGTTGKPKGVVSTHLNIEAQVTSLIQAWQWTAEDYILHVLPLHHVHGIVNVLTCALWAGARCEILPRFDPQQTWQKFIERDLTIFMAVPSIYVKLTAAWESSPQDEKRLMREACGKLRLMVSGSAALPMSVLERWKAITGHKILERYGMTEIGMALSKPLRGDRIAGCVGTALPGVEVRLVNDDGHPAPLDTPGEIQVRGPMVFLEYWRRPEETSKAFSDHWFWTGDIAMQEKGIYRILGRKSMDIIKTGGYKVSALEIEEVLRAHPAIAECAVLGQADPEWGERVCAALILRRGERITFGELRGWGKTRLAPYKVPSRIMILDELPRNPLGKVKKQTLRQLFES